MKDVSIGSRGVAIDATGRRPHRAERKLEQTGVVVEGYTTVDHEAPGTIEDSAWVDVRAQLQRVLGPRVVIQLGRWWWDSSTSSTHFFQSRKEGETKIIRLVDEKSQFIKSELNSESRTRNDNIEQLNSCLEVPTQKQLTIDWSPSPSWRNQGRTVGTWGNGCQHHQEDERRIE